MHSIRIYIYLPYASSAVSSQTSNINNMYPSTTATCQLPTANNLPTLSFCHPSQTLRSQSSSRSHSRPPNTHSVYMSIFCARLRLCLRAASLEPLSRKEPQCSSANSVGVADAWCASGLHCAPALVVDGDADRVRGHPGAADERCA